MLPPLVTSGVGLDWVWVFFIRRCVNVTVNQLNGSRVYLNPYLF